jgi:hypothetical protein
MQKHGIGLSTISEIGHEQRRGYPVLITNNNNNNNNNNKKKKKKKKYNNSIIIVIIIGKLTQISFVKE